MISVLWLIAAIVATARGAGWKPWAVVGTGLLFSVLVGFLMGLTGTGYDGSIWTVSFVVEIFILLGTLYFAIRPKGSSY